MAELVPVPLAELLGRALAEHERAGAIFDLPARSFWHGSPLDLSVTFHGTRAATAAGPAAGPHSQLAQNIALTWLAGARIVELKTIQLSDRLQIPRPCIDVTNVGYNVEWSQELRLEESLLEYAKAWLLVHVLAGWNPAGLRQDEQGTIFDASVGYSLAGITSDPVARWLDGLADAAPLLALLKSELPANLAAAADVPVPSRISDCVTLSTFHGCPADEIEAIALHLLARHRVHVVVKCNPTLLGFELACELLRGRLGYDDVRLHRPAFAADPGLDALVAMVRRLASAAASLGLSVGVKLTNTLVVENHRSFFPASERLMYLSGQPLHVLAVQLAHRFVEATCGTVPVSFSAGIDRTNFHHAVACGFVPVTACTDLLRPGGYARLPKYLAGLEAEMRRVGVTSVDGLIAQRGGARRALAEYAEKVLNDPRYAAARNRGAPRRIGRELALFDCIACDKCVPVCPNDANFSITLPTEPVATQVVVVGEDGTARVEPGDVFQLSEAQQLANYADLCNECGNCDVFCPETGGPYRVKPRFFSSSSTYLAEPRGDGFLVTPGAIIGRIEGIEHRLTLSSDRALFSDGRVTVDLTADGSVSQVTIHAHPSIGHRLPLWRYHAMRALYDGVMAGVNPVSARTLA